VKKLLVAAIIFLLLPVVSYGQLITIQIEATVNYLDDYYNLLQGKVALGSTITGTYTYDTSTPDTNPFSWGGEYLHYAYPCGLRLTVGGFDFMSDPTHTKFGVGIVNNYLNQPQDNYGIASTYNLPLSNETLVDYVSWSLSDYSGTALSSVALPTDAPILSDWDDSYNTLHISGGIGGTSPCYDKTFNIHAKVISAVLVPEPVSIMLLGFGLLALRKRK
jgi:hypothetical protein